MVSTSASSERERRVEPLRAPGDRLEPLPHLRRDLLPLGDLRRRADVLELEAERGGLRVAGESRLVPRRAPGRQVAAERPEALLRRRLGEELDDLPRRVLPRRGAEDDEARSPGEGDAGPRHPVGCRERRGRPRALEARREPAPELPEVPRPRDVHRELAGGHLLVEVRDLGVRQRRCEAVAVEADEELRRAPELGSAEGAVPPSVRQQLGAGGDGEGHRLRPLVRREEETVAADPSRSLHRLHRRPPAAPAPRELGDAGRREEVAPVEDEPRVDVPGHPVEDAVEDVRLPDPRVVVVRTNRRARRDARVERLDRVQGGHLGNPGVPHLRHVGHLAADEAGQQLLVRRRPGNLLNLDLQAGVAPLDLGNELADDLSFAPEGPETHGFGAIPAARAGRRRGQDEARGEGSHGFGAASSQPPVNPARRRPARIGGDCLIRLHIRPLLWFSIIRTIGPWSMPR